jgi:hypothetical protein
MRRRYRNTLTFGIGTTAVFKRPSGSRAAAWDALRTLRPELDGARITDSGYCLNVQVERTMGTVAARTMIVDSIAEAFRSPLETYGMTWNGQPGTIWATVISYQGERICVETADCSCHPDGSTS